jgi:carbon storage regulator
MLLLTRKAGQKIRINHDITVTLVSGLDGRVVIGIEAPRNVTVHREEVYQRIMESQKEKQS